MEQNSEARNGLTHIYQVAFKDIFQCDLMKKNIVILKSSEENLDISWEKNEPQLLLYTIQED